MGENITAFERLVNTETAQVELAEIHMYDKAYQDLAGKSLDVNGGTQIDILAGINISLRILGKTKLSPCYWKCVDATLRMLSVSK
jgi:hypothetical protein